MRLRIHRFLPLILMIPLVIACANSSVQTSTTSTDASGAGSTAAASTGTTVGSETIDQAVNAVWNAMQSRNENRMRFMIPSNLQGQIGTSQWQQFLTCAATGSTVTLAGHTISTTGKTAKVTVTFNVSVNNGTPTTVTRVWNFAQMSNGLWVLANLPGCPLK